VEVIKRNGTSEPFNFAKVEKVIEFACPDKEHIEKFKEAFTMQLKPRMTSKEIQQALIQTAVELTSPQEPEWDSVSAKLYLYDLYKEAGINRGYRKKQFGYGDFYKLVKMLTDMGLYGDYIMKAYKKADIEELGQYIKPERDELLTYVGVRTLAERYLVRGHNREVYELPQEAFMGVAMALASVEEPERRVEWAKKFYDVMSQLKMIVATPTMSNARKPHKQLSSCFIATVEDSLESILNVGSNFGFISKLGGGMGIYIGKVRAAGSDIRGFKNVAAGIVPWIRIYNDIAVAVDQLGVRKGAVSITLDVWHRDIFDFLQLKTNNGDERMKAHDIFPAVSIPDIFMEQVKKKGKWYLFDPHEVRTIMGYSLEDYYDDGVNNEFSKRYWECVNHPDLPKQEVNAMDIMKAIIKSDTETGTPFLFFRDQVNRMNPNKHVNGGKAMIYSSNLCTEIAQNMSANGELVTKIIKDKETGDEIVVEMRKSGDLVVCNLASLNLGRTHTEEDLAEVTPIVIRMLDNVITLNSLPVPEATITNSKYRAVGLGTYGYHHALALNKIMWETEEHLEFADKLYENIAYYAIRGSMELAKERGAYHYFEGSEWHTGEYFVRRGYVARNENGEIIPIEGKERWYDLCKDVMKYGLRNGYLMAVAPNGSSSLYGGSTASIDPVYSKFYFDEKKGQVVPVIAPDLKECFWYYKEAHNIDQTWSIRANAVRQRHIDQSQSFNLYITPQTTAVELLKMYLLAWELGCKTMYYTRSRSVEIEECVSCAV
jgi:ribonucleoside-diphosphate reductase alpha chain